MRAGRIILRSLVTLSVLAGVALLSGTTVFAATPEEPLLTTATTAITPTTATINGELNPGTSSEELEYYFAYNTGETCTGGETAPDPPAKTNGNHQNVSTILTGLEPDTNYSFCLIAVNASKETSTSTPVAFATKSEEPTVYGESAPSGLITAISATLEAEINPNNQETTYFYRYATEATGEELEGTINKVKNSEAISPVYRTRYVRSYIPGGLEPSHTYYYRIIVQNATGTTEGPVESFTTLPAEKPVVVTGEGQDPTRTSVVVPGSVNPEGLLTGYQVTYIDQAGYEAAIARSAEDPYAAGTSTPITNLVAGYTLLPVLVPVEELQPGTTYHYAVIASNQLGVTVGQDKTFTTAPSTPPVVTTGEATGVSQVSATLTGTVNTNELQSTLEFEIGTALYTGAIKPASITEQAGSIFMITASFPGTLQPDVTYYYRVIATSADGTSYGAERSFTTPTFPEPASFTTTPLLANLTTQPIPTTTTTTPKKTTTTKKTARKKKKTAHGKTKKRKKTGHKPKKSK